jgi:aspartate-semialdehyde dehydrogenase
MSKTASSLPHVAVVGATGAVGIEMLACLEQRGFPHASIRALASARSAGQRFAYSRAPGGHVTVEALTPEALRGVDLALFSAGSGITKEIAPAAARLGVCIVDNSSAFRMDPGVPLVVPEVNPGALAHSAQKTARGWPTIVANPNCSTIILLMALTPLRNAFGVSSAVVSTYQAASGAGAKGMNELEEQTRADLAGQTIRAGTETGGVFHEPYAFNIFSHNTAVDPATGLNVEEVKMIKETHKIWEDPSVLISPTCIRVPTRRAHAESVHVTLKKPATQEQVQSVLGEFPGVRVIDDRANNRFPTPLKASGKDDVLVGRIRPSPLQPKPVAELSGRGAYTQWDLFICGDQLRKGAALNAVQIAELLVKA